MEQILKQLLDWATRIKNQNVVDGNSSTIVGGGLEKLINALSDLNKNKAENKTIDEVKASIANATINNKGVFETDASLRLLYPQATNLKGWYAFVGTVNPRIKYIVKANGTDWSGTTEKHHVVETELNEYVKNKAIYNISQLHDKYDYANNQTARNVILAASRSLGQVVSYKLNTGKWITEQYIGVDVSGWALVANWKYLGGLQAEDIHQLVDSTTDKPISPNGVLKWVEGLGVVGYKETTTTTPIDFTNLIDEANLVTGSFINNAGVIGIEPQCGYNPDYFAVKADTEYYSNIFVSFSDRSEIVLYDSNKNIIGTRNFRHQFKTAPLTAFIRYNIQNNSRLTPLFLYQKEKTTTEVSDTPVLDIGVKDLNNATEVDVPLVGNILPFDLIMSVYYLGHQAEIVQNGSWFHSDFFPIKGGVVYEQNTIGLGSYVRSWFYDGEKNPIFSFESGHRTATSPNNARFARISNNKITLDGVYFREKETIKCIVIPELYVPQKNILTEDTNVAVHSYTAIGDSITTGDSYADMLSRSLGLTTFQKYAANGIGMGALLPNIVKIPDNYRGLVTIMLGTNDIGSGTPVGDFDEVMAKPFANLANGSSFIESLRISLDTLLQKAPECKIVVISPIQRGGQNDEINAKRYREALEKVCERLSVPYSTLYKTCGISYATNKYFLSDGVHPNSGGQALIHKALLPFVRANI